MADRRAGPGVTDTATDPETTAADTAATDGDATDTGATGTAAGSTTDPAPPDPAPDGTGPAGAADVPPRRGRLAVVAVALLLVVALVAAVLSVLAWRGTAGTVADRDEATAVASQVVRDFIGIDADNAKGNVENMLAVATDPFRTELGRFSEVFGAILAQGKVRAEGGIDAVGIEHIDADTATVLVSASTTVRNTEVPDGAPRDFRLLLGLRHEDGAWKVSTVEVAP
jgi:Mce-associated membrane protein